MTLKELVAEVAKREGLSNEVSIGNIREIIGIISDIAVEKPIGAFLYANGRRRQKARKK